jgi:hypothetical protein
LGVHVKGIDSQNVSILQKLMKFYTINILSFSGLKGKNSEARRKEVQRAVQEANEKLVVKKGEDETLPSLTIVDKPEDKVKWTKDFGSALIADDRPSIINEALEFGFQAFPIETRGRNNSFKVTSYTCLAGAADVLLDRGWYRRKGATKSGKRKLPQRTQWDK